MQILTPFNMMEILFYEKSCLVKKSNSPFRLNKIEFFYALVARRIHICGYKLPKIGAIAPAAFLSTSHAEIISMAYKQLN